MAVQDSQKLRVIFICAMLVLATFVVFEPLRHNDFISFDDDKYITENPHIREGITRESLVWAFTSGYAGNWHPLTWLSHMLDIEFFGLDPLWHHMSNLLFHIANTLLLFLLLHNMTGAMWRSAFVAAAFGLHPVHIESVAWVAERKDVLSGLFWLLTMAAYVRYTRHSSVRKYLLVVLLLGLGLMAKSMLVTLPFVLLLLDYWPLRRLNWRTVVEKIPLIILSVICCVVTYIVQQSGGAMTAMEVAPLSLRLSNALVSYASYLGKMIYPTDLAILYPFPINGLPWWQPTCAFLLLASLSVFAVYTARRGRYILTGWLWYLGTLVPVIGLVKVGVQAMADRYTYLPSIGIFIAIAWGAVQLLSRWRHCRLALGISAGLLIGVMFICTRQQVHYWRDSFTLYKHALNVTEDNHRIHDNFGTVLSAQGKLDEAIRHYLEALRIKPNSAKFCFNLAVALKSQGKLDEAIRHYRRALRIKPDYAEAYNNLGSVLLVQGKLDEAIWHYRRTLEIRPDSVQARRNLERALSEQGKLDEAIER